MTLSEFVKEGVRALSAIYPLPEARGMVLYLYSSRLGIPDYRHVTEPDMPIPPDCTLEEDMSRLLKGEPLQYVLGECEFLGRKFRLSPDVLIPRPETEEMVLLAEKNIRPGDSVLDLCTGSGCIAWSIFKDIPGSRVTAVDISGPALDVARSQFDGPGPDFVQADILREPAFRGRYDFVVSNPPYVLESQKSLMRRNVLDYEPDLALFVPDSDPLKFYRAVSFWASSLEIPAGIVEINDLLSEETAAVFREAGYLDCQVLGDLSGRPRFVLFRR